MAQLGIVVQVAAAPDPEPAPAVGEVGGVRSLRPAEEQRIVALRDGHRGVEPAIGLPIPLDLRITDRVEEGGPREGAVVAAAQ